MWIRFGRRDLVGDELTRLRATYSEDDIHAVTSSLGLIDFDMSWSLLVEVFERVAQRCRAQSRQ